MLTVVVKATKSELSTKLAKYGFGQLAAEAKTRELKGMNGCLAIQHPRLVQLGADAIYDLCRFAGIPLEFTTDQPVFK